jgi:hypothetical protein
LQPAISRDTRHQVVIAGLDPAIHRLRKNVWRRAMDPRVATMAAPNKCLAQSNKSRTARDATNKRLRRQSGAVWGLHARLARHLGVTMLKTLIIATVLLPTLALAQRSQQLPQPRQPGQWCPVGWMASGNYCVPGSDNAPAAIPKNGWCPAGWRESGSYCIR